MNNLNYPNRKLYDSEYKEAKHSNTGCFIFSIFVLAIVFVALTIYNS